MVRMADLCVIDGSIVNRISEIQSETIKNKVFNEFYKASDFSWNCSVDYYALNVFCDKTLSNIHYFLELVAREVSKEKKKLGQHQEDGFVFAIHN
jgi:hypothetical protein